MVFRRVEPERGPDLRALREVEARRHDADDFITPAAHLDAPAHDGRVCSEASHPEAVADNYDRVAPGLRVVREQRTPARCADADDAEEVGRDARGGDALRLRAPPPGPAPPPVRRAPPAV